MKIIVLERDDKVVVASEEELTKEFHEQYKKNGNGMDKEDFFYEFFYCETINGEIYYSDKDDCVIFEYSDWSTKLTYHHIESCIEWLQEDKSKYICSFNKYTMFHVLMALNFCGAIGKREYDVLHEKYCRYGEEH